MPEVPGGVASFPAMEAAANPAAGRSEAVPWVVAGGVTALVAAAVFFGGASGDGSVFELGLLAVVVCGAGVLGATLGAVRLPRLDRAGAATIAVLLTLVAWVGFSIVWSVAGDRSWSALNKGLVYVLFLLAGILLGCLEHRCARGAAAVLAGVIGLALLWALAGKAVPGLFPDGGRIARLRNPVGYWNALALLADAAVALGLWLATSFALPRWRVGGGVLVYFAVLVVLLTQSRAGVGAALAAALLWLWFAPARRVEGALVAVAAGVPACLVGGWAFTRPALVDDGAAHAARVDDGAVFGVLALAGAALTVVLVLLPLGRIAVERRRAVMRGLIAVAALGVLLGAAGVVAAAGDEFSQRECTDDPSRLGSVCANNRLEWWGEALDVWRANPVVGAGAGTFEIARTRYREDASAVTEPHSVPLQALADGGIVGLGLLLAVVVAAAVGVARALRRLRGPERAAAGALAVFPAVYALHALVDYDLDFAAVTGPMLVGLGALLAAGRPTRPAPRWLGFAAAGAAGLAVVASLGSPALASRGVERAYELLDSGEVDRAADLARRAEELDPLSLEPVWARARAAARAGDERSALLFYERATTIQPENADTWHALGLFRLDVLRDGCGAYEALNRAYTLDPKSRRWTPGGPLDVARDAVNAGACER
jgi:tetratricopeptide (TPR) repeat protein